MPSFAGKPFIVLESSGGMPVGGPAWDKESFVARRRVAGGGERLQALGFGAGTVTYPLMFETEDAWQDVQDLVQTTGTLVDWDGVSVTTVFLESLTDGYRMLDGRMFATAKFTDVSAA